jgi:hypothetical protein
MPRSCEIIRFTPELAQEWLTTKNKRNRSISMSRVKTYAQEMQCGRWKSTNGGVGVDVDGFISDGQHTLRAIVESGVTMDVPVVYGCDRCNGFAPGPLFRSSLHNFEASGKVMNKYTAAALKELTKILTPGGTRIHDGDILDVSESFGEEMDTARNICHSFCLRSGVSYSATFSVSFFVMCYMRPFDDVHKVFSEVLGGENLKPNSEAQKMHKHMPKTGVGSQSKAQFKSFTKSMLTLMLKRKSTAIIDGLDDEIDSAVKSLYRSWKGIEEA